MFGGIGSGSAFCLFLVAAFSLCAAGVASAGSPILSLSISVQAQFVQGSTGEWDLTVNNNGASSFGNPTDGSTVTVIDTLPAGYTLQAGFGTSWNISTGASNTVICTTTTVVEGGGGSFPTIHLTVNVPSNSPLFVVDNAGVFGGGDQNHTNMATAATAFNNVSVTQVPALITINAGAKQMTLTNQNFATMLAATVMDAGNVTISNYSPVIFAATNAPGSPGGTFTLTSSGTNSVSSGVNGIANAGTFKANNYPGAYVVTVTAGPAPPVGINLTNATFPHITSATNTLFVVGLAGLFPVVASGFPMPVLSESGRLPPDVKFSRETGGLVGTPVSGSDGVYPITFSADNATASPATQNFSLVVISPPNITACKIIGGMPTITFTTISSQTYRVERKTDLADANWVTVTGAGNISGTGNKVSVADPDAGASKLAKRFYRVVMLMQ
jgi:hypothetical protein